MLAKIVRKLRNKVVISIYGSEFDRFNKKVFSQNGEDGIIEEIFRRIGVDTKFAVEFGVEDGRECNTRYLKERRHWKVLQMDGNDNNPKSIKKEYITPQNINQLFKKYKVPFNLDMLSIDVDSSDLWIWKALNTDYRPRLVVVEYNATIAPCYAKSVKYEKNLHWDGTNYFGASLLAFYKLAKIRGYSLVCCDMNGVNAFFVRNDLLNSAIPAKNPVEAYRGPRYGQEPEPGVFIGHFPPTREFVDINDNVDIV